MMESNNTTHHHYYHQQTVRDTREIFEKLAWPIFSGIFDASSKTFPATGDGLVRELQVLRADNPKNHGAYFFFFFGTILSLSVSNLMCVCVFFFHNNKCNCFLVVCYVWKGMGWGGGWRNVVHDVTYGFVCLWSQLELKWESELGGWKCIISTLTLLTFYARVPSREMVSPHIMVVARLYELPSTSLPFPVPAAALVQFDFCWLTKLDPYLGSVGDFINCVMESMRGPACLFGVAAHLVDHYYNKLAQQFDYD